MVAVAPCQFKLGPAPACGEPSIDKVTVRFPAWVGELLRPDQRIVDLDVCAEHREFLGQMQAGDSFDLPDVLARAAGERLPAAARDDIPVPTEHREHKAWTPDCLGCSLDFAPPW